MSAETTTGSEESDERSDERKAERKVRRTVARDMRPRRTVPAVIVALLLAVVSLAVVVEVVSRLIGQPLGLIPVDDLANLGTDTQWSDPLPIIVAIIVCLVGLLLLLLALIPGHTRQRALSATRQEVVVAIGTDDLGRLATHAAEHVNGVDRAVARTDNGRVAVRVDTPLHDPGDLSDEVRQAVHQRIDQLHLQQPPDVRVRVRNRGD